MTGAITAEPKSSPRPRSREVKVSLLGGILNDPESGPEMTSMARQSSSSNYPAKMKAAQFKAIGLDLRRGQHYDDWRELGGFLKGLQGRVMWWWGDWLNFGKSEYGEKYEQALDESGYEYQTLANAAWVSNSIEISRRRESLTWGHHEAVASLSDDEQDKWLGLAEAGGWSRSVLRKRLAASRDTILDLEALADLGGLVDYDTFIRRSLEAAEAALPRIETLEQAVFIYRFAMLLEHRIEEHAMDTGTAA